MAMTGRDDLIVNPRVPFGRMSLGRLVLDGRQSLGKLRAWITRRMSPDRLGRDLNVKRVVGHVLGKRQVLGLHIHSRNG
jgi:hypothetical protein